jgi:hypothetical protein
MAWRASLSAVEQYNRRHDMQWRKCLSLLASLAALCVLTSSPAAVRANSEPALTPTQARAIGREVFLWGMHPVAIYQLRYQRVQNEHSPVYVGIDRMQWNRKPISAARGATTPNASTMYGVAMTDLSQDPLVITAPAIHDRYWSIQLFDNYANWWGMIGSQFSAPGPVKRLLVGPNWRGRIPAEFAGAEVLQSSSNFAGVLARIAITDRTSADYAAINGIMDQITVMPLSKWLAAGQREVRAEDMPAVRGDYPVYPGMEAFRTAVQIKGVDFLRWVSLVLNDTSFTKKADSASEQRAFSDFARLGLKAGQPFDPASLTPEIRAAVEAGIEDGRQQVTAAMFGHNEHQIDMNGWLLDTDLGYRDSDWEERAGMGLLAVLGPVPLRSHTAAWGNTDSEGRPLTGEHRYTITFDLKDMPPVSEFWELPLYDTQGYFYDNPLNRYSFTSYDLRRGRLYTGNGKVVIYVQHDEPADPQQRENWLPAPKDGFRFAARFYGAYGPLIDGSYAMPRPVRVD